jgi:hypothetical protein
MAQPTSGHDGSGICRTAAQIEMPRIPTTPFGIGTENELESCDQHFVLGAQSGERNSFNAFAPKCRHRLMKLSMRHTRNPAEAEDAPQNTFRKDCTVAARARCADIWTR